MLPRLLHEVALVATDEPIFADVTTRFRGGPIDGQTRTIRSDELGYLPRYPTSTEHGQGLGGTYWPTFDRDGQEFIHEWQAGKPKAPSWLETEMPRVRSDAGGRRHFVPADPDD